MSGLKGSWSGLISSTLPFLKWQMFVINVLICKGLLSDVPFMKEKISPWSVFAAAKSLQLCLTLCDPIDGSPPGSPVPGILQAKTLEWLAISFSSAWKAKVKSLSRVWLLATPWTATHQAPPPMGFSRQEYWSEVPLPSPKGVSTRGRIWNKVNLF